MPATASSPRTLTATEQHRLLQATARRRRDYRDHVIYSLALATGLREHELAGLDVGDVYDEAGRPRSWLRLRVYKRSRSRFARQEVPVSTLLQDKLARFRRWKQLERESLDAAAPLLVSRLGRRISLRQLRHGFHVWQRRAGFERRYGFHSLRHSACQRIYESTGDIRLTQRFARHASLVTTMIYTHPGDEALVRAVDGLAVG